MKRISMIDCAIAAALTLGPTGCRTERDRDLLPPPGYVDPPVKPLRNAADRARLPQLGTGFYDVETAPDGSTFRWMGKAAEVTLPRLDKPGKLRIVGWAPIELLGAPPTLTVSLEGRTLETFVPPAGHFPREWLVPREAFGAAVAGKLTITTSATASPPGDTRLLGFAIESVTWTPID